MFPAERTRCDGGRRGWGNEEGFVGRCVGEWHVGERCVQRSNAPYLLGRFVSPDSIIPQPGSPQAWDRYSYVNNSPVNYTDPSGPLWYPLWSLDRNWRNYDNEYWLANYRIS
jgi:hypothetical protein